MNWTTGTRLARVTAAPVGAVPSPNSTGRAEAVASLPRFGSSLSRSPHPEPPMRLSVVQMNPGADKDENIAQARRLIDEAVQADRPNIVSLPEVWDSLGGDRTVRQSNAELLPAKGSNEPGGPAYEFLRDTARSHKVHVHGGSIIEKRSEKLFNTTVVFDPRSEEHTS